MRQKTLLLLGIMFTVNSTFGQLLKKQTLSSQGSSEFVYTTTTSYFLQQSIGQGSVINSFSTDDNTLRQGFLQPLSPAALIDATTTTLDATIYPNPFQNEIYILFNEPVVGPVSITIYDILGRIVYIKELVPNPMLRLQVGRLAGGIYIIRVVVRNKSLTAKLIRE